MFKKLHILLIFSILVVTKPLRSNHRMRNLIAIFAKFLEICKDFSSNLVNESGNVPRRGVVLRFSDLELIALSMTAEHLSVDSENLFFHILREYQSSIPNLIPHRQYNDRRKQT